MKLLPSSIRARVVASGALCALAIAGLGGVSLWREHASAQALRGVYEGQVRPMQDLQRIDATLKDVRFRLAGVLLDQMPVQGSRNQLRDAQRAVPEHWRQYRAAMNDGLPAERVALHAAIDGGLDTALGFMQRLDAAYGRNDRKALEAMLEDDWPTVQTALVKPIEQLLPVVAESVRSTYDAQMAASRRTVATMLPATLLLTAAFAAFAWWFVRTLGRVLDGASRAIGSLADGDLGARLPERGDDEIARFGATFNAAASRLAATLDEVRQRASSIDAASGEIAQGNADLSGRTELQASGLQQTAASTERLATTVRENHGRSEEAARYAGESARRAGAAGEAVRRAVSTMADIDASSKRIEQIISVIDGIAFQTNILALNAAVEAARAGEQGRGFAVVAAEVRSLAQRSATAAREIRSLISASVEQVGAGGELIASVGASMAEVVASVQEVATLVEGISDASRVQAEGVEQISAAVTRMDTGTQQNAALVEQAAAASESLREQAAALRALVDRFRTGEHAVAA